MKIVGATGLVGLWALEWAWQSFFNQSVGTGETNKFQLKLALRTRLRSLNLRSHQR